MIKVEIALCCRRLSFRIASVVFIGGDSNKNVKAGHLAILRGVLVLAGGCIGINRVLIRMILGRTTKVLQGCQQQYLRKPKKITGLTF